MKDLIPSWLEDPSAYAQAPNLDMSTVALVALANLWAGVVCVAVFEVQRRRRPRLYAPKEAQEPGSTPDAVHGPGTKPGAPLGWVRPLMALSDEEVLRRGGYDVLVYLRFVRMATKIFAAFAPYAFVVLLPVNASVFFLANQTELSGSDGTGGSAEATANTFNRLSMSSMPAKDPRMWAHCLGVYVLTGLTMRFLSAECRWYTRLRHRFLSQQDEARHRTVLVSQIPTDIRTSQKLADYFHKLYPGKVVGAAVYRRVDRLDALAADRDAEAARLERLRDRLTRAKIQSNEYGHRRSGQCRALWTRFARALEDAYDPLAWTLESEKRRLELHEDRLRRLDKAIHAERARHLDGLDGLVARPTGVVPPRYTGDVSSSSSASSLSAAGGGGGGSSLSAGVDPKKKATPYGESSGVVPEDGVEEETKDPYGDSYQSRRRGVNDGSDEESDEEAPSTRRSTSWTALCQRPTRRYADYDDGEAVALLPTAPGRLARAASGVLCGAATTTSKNQGNADSDALDVGLVTFNCFAGAAIATQVYHAATPGGVVPQMAPEPRDIFWPNLAVSPRRRATRRVAANVVVALLLIFYVVPVTLISFVLSEQAVYAKWPAVAKAADASLFVAVCVKMLQPAGLIALMLLLPPLFLGLGFWEGHLAWSSNTLAQLSRYYSFLVTNVLLVTTVAGSLVKCLQKIIDHPGKTVTLLGQSLPQVCAFFSCYVFIKAFGGLPLELCRGVAMAQHLAKRCIYPSSTARDRRAVVLGLRDLDNPGWFSYGKFAAQDLLVVALLMTYAVMAPVILVPGLLFFAIAQVVYRHQLLYVYVPLFESGGLLWPRIYRRTLFSLFILQFTMTGLFFLKSVYTQGYACLALSVATYLYKIHMRHLFANSASVAHHLPIELATAVDDAMRHDRDPAADDAVLWDGLHRFIQPGLRDS